MDNKKKKIIIGSFSGVVLILVILFCLFVFYNKEKTRGIGETGIKRTLLELIFKVEGFKGIENYAMVFKEKKFYENYEEIFKFWAEKKFQTTKNEDEMFEVGKYLFDKQLYYIADEFYQKGITTMGNKIKAEETKEKRIILEQKLILLADKFVFENYNLLVLLGDLSDRANDKDEIKVIESKKCSLLIKIEGDKNIILNRLNNKLSIEEKEEVYNREMKKLLKK